MNRFLLCALAGAFWMSLPRSAAAQEERAFTGQLTLDTRSLVQTGGKTRAGVYGTGLAVNGKLGKGWRLNFNGMQTNAPNIAGAGARFDRFTTQEANVEYGRGAQTLAFGMVRLPFGLYDHRETYASGLIDYPLLRGDYALQALDWGVMGVKYTGYRGNVQWETSAFGGQGTGMWGNVNNAAGAALRLQTFYKGLIFGVSRWDGSTSTAGAGPERTHLTGLDVRYTRPHLLLRGEYIGGDHGGERAHGFYVDAFYHLPKFERWSVAMRWENFAPESEAPTTRQFTLGVRYTLSKDWVLALNWRKNNGPDYAPSWTPASGSAGDFYFQAYRKIGL